MAETDGETRKLVKPRVHHATVEALARRILEGEFQPGDHFPSEAVLRAEMNLSRSSLREAVRVLNTKGLVSSRPRAGTIVRPQEEWNMLDGDLLTWSMSGKPSAQLVLSLIEARQAIEPAAARLAAMRASEADIAPLEVAFADMEKFKACGDFKSFNNADIDFHVALLRASGNVVFIQLANTIGAALAYSFRVTVANAREPGASLANHGEVISLIKARDANGARNAMHQLLNIAIVDLGLNTP